MSNAGSRIPKLSERQIPGTGTNVFLVASYRCWVVAATQQEVAAGKPKAEADLGGKRKPPNCETFLAAAGEKKKKKSRPVE